MTPERYQPEHRKIHILTEFLTQGIGMMREGKYADAMKYFHNKHVAKSIGVEFEDTPRALMARKPIITIDQMQSIVHTCALHSYVDFGIKGTETVPFMTLTGFFIPEEVKQASEQSLIGRIYHNMSLLFAEEWAHILQQYGGPLAGKKDWDIDVAFYFQAQGVSLTEEFLARHDRWKYFK